MPSRDIEYEVTVDGCHECISHAKDDNQDMKRKGRVGGASGEKNGASKLTADQVRDIRTSDASDRDTAIKYNISYWTVNKIRHGRRWPQVASDS
jgi:hypothetical protein